MQISDENSYEDLVSDNDQVIEQLKSISEKLAEKSLVVLKRAHASGETKRPEVERSLTQARRAVEKAISLLSRG